MKQIDQSFKGLDGRAAVLVIGHEDGITRGHFAANLGERGWKVAAGGGWVWHERKPVGYFQVAKIWGGAR